MPYYLYIHNIYLYQYHDTKPNTINIDWLLGLTPTDIPVKIEGIYIPANFVVVDILEDHDVPIILRRPFLATAGAIVDVKNRRIVFQVSDEMVGFEVENVMKGPALYSCCMINDHDVKERFLASSTQYDLFDPF